MSFNKYVAEIRFSPDPTVLDRRGKIVSRLISQEFKDWKITENRIEVFTKDSLVFVSFNNLGFTTINENELEDNINKIESAIDAVGQVPPVRWGLRIFSLVASNKRFPSLIEKYKKELLNFEPENFSSINADLVDVGVSYIFKNSNNFYHLTSGPMKKQQAKQYFPLPNLPANSLFFDLDIYREKDSFRDSDNRKRRIIDFVRESLTEGRNLISQFSQKLNGR